MKLENWSIGCIENPFLQLPEYQEQRLNGDVYGHTNPRFFDGKNITTSPLIGKLGDKVLTMSGSLYELGKVKDEYEKLFPNARERLMNSLPEEVI